VNRLTEIKDLALQINRSDDALVIAASAARIEQLAQEEIDNRESFKSTLSDLVDISQDILGTNLQ
jgi:hypothetical protein